MAFIDAHVHVWTPDTDHYPLAAGFKKEDMKPASFTPEELFKHTKPAGVDRVNLIQMSYYATDNRYMLDMIAMYPEVFVGTAIVDPLGKEPEREMTALVKKKVRAFRIAPNMSKQPIEKWLEPAGFSKMFDAGMRNNQAISLLINPDAIPEVERMCKKFPKTPVIVDHLARIGVDGKFKDADVDALCGLAKHDRVMVKVGAFYALGKKQPPYTDLGPLIQKVVKAFGAKRCMWESDCPFQVVDQKYQDSVDLIHKKLDFLTDDDRDRLLTKTAEEFFFKK